jgi:hypothetical protein
VRFSITKRGVATPIVALVAVAAFAGIASAAPAVSLTKFGDGDVTMSGMSATLANGAGEYSGVYVKNKSLSATPLANVDFSFDYEGAVAGGAPRFSIPLSTGSYAFIDAINSGNTGTVSTDDPNAKVFINTGGEYANWDAMVAANPTWRIGSGKVPFVIADQPGTYEISNIVLR